jgi:hypothetical protein
MRGSVRVEAEKEGQSEIVDIFVSDIMANGNG